MKYCNLSIGLFYSDIAAFLDQSEAVSSYRRKYTTERKTMKKMATVYRTKPLWIGKIPIIILSNNMTNLSLNSASKYKFNPTKTQKRLSQRWHCGIKAKPVKFRSLLVVESLLYLMAFPCYFTN